MERCGGNGKAGSILASFVGQEGEGRGGHKGQRGVLERKHNEMKGRGAKKKLHRRRALFPRL